MGGKSGCKQFEQAFEDDVRRMFERGEPSLVRVRMEFQLPKQSVDLLVQSAKDAGVSVNEAAIILLFHQLDSQMSREGRVAFFSDEVFETFASMQLEGVERRGRGVVE